MFFFLIKKAFFDAWDNLGILILANLTSFVVIVAGVWPITRLLENGSVSGIPILILLIPALFVVGGVTSSMMSRIADYKRPAWGDIPTALRKTWKYSLLLTLFLMLFFPISAFGMRYYAGMKTTLGLAAMALLFWISLGVYLVSIWFFPVLNRLSGGFRKSLKKCSLIMLDNLGISLFAGLFVIPLQMILWPFTAFGAFGPAGVQLYMDDALRLLLLKYDWLEDHSEAGKRDIPWFELLIDEREKVGKRTLKGMIFPWKE